MRSIALALFCLSLVSACGGDKAPQPEPGATAPAEEKAAPAEEKAATPAPTPPPPAVEPTVAKPDADGVVHMTGNDLMRYNATRIEVTGTKFKIELKHIGKLPKEGMGHNLVVLKPGTDAVAFATSAASARATDYIPEAGKAQIIAHTKLVGGGESDTIEVELPGPGTYPFCCTFPGHAALMHGELVATAE